MEKEVCDMESESTIDVRGYLIAVGITVLSAVCFAGEGVQPFVVPTFHCLGVYWSPEKGEAGRKVLVKYREGGQDRWRNGLPMRHHPAETPFQVTGVPFVGRIRRQTGITDPLHPGMIFQKLGYLEGVLAVTFHSHGQGLQPLQKDPGVIR